MLKELEASPLVHELNKIINADTTQEDGDKDPNNNIILITEKDNLVHNYFHYFETSFDCVNCLSTVLVKMPKMDEKNTNYWINYNDYILVYLGNSIAINSVAGESTTTEDVQNISEASSVTPPSDGSNSADRYFNTLGLKPVFKGKISRVKEHSNELELYIDSIGRRFKQKIPKEFRESYIYNQNVRDAFQAICEFLGVYYVCPPPARTDDSDTDEEGAEGNSTEKTYTPEYNNANYIRRENAKIAGKARRKAKEEKEGNKADTTKTNSDSSSESDSSEENQEEETTETDSSGEVLLLNGYNDVEFDSGGNITIGGTVIEDSINIANTLLATEETPAIEYDEVDPTIKEDIQKLFAGFMFDELHNETMDYGAITIEPKSSSSSDITTAGGATTGTTTEESDSNSSSGTPYWKQQGFSSLASYDKYQAKKNSGEYKYYIQSKDKGWQKVIYRRYLYAYQKGWVTRMDKGKIKGKSHGSIKPLWKDVLKI